MTRRPEGKISTGIAGLDEILSGGFAQRRTYMVSGVPGTGKTILGCHFLSTDTENEKSLFISLQQTERDICQDAANLGIDMSHVTVLDLSASLATDSTTELFSTKPSQNTITNYMLKTIKNLQPNRIFIDPLTHFRFLSSSIFNFRKQVLNMLRFLNDEGITVLFSSDFATGTLDEDLQILADGIISLQRTEGRRKLIVQKMRGSDFMIGSHSFKISSTGIHVFPRLIPEEHSIEFSHEMVDTGIPGIDQLLGGGIERGTITMVSGPSGAGKTSIGLQFMKSAANRGERSVLYAFEEEVDIVKKQAESIKTPISALVDRGMISIQHIESLKYSPDEFALMVKEEVEEKGARIVMIDSISGYSLSIEGENLKRYIYALGKYLQRMGVAVFLVLETSNFLNSIQISELDISFLSDNIIFLRYFEADGGLRRAVGVLKKRMGDFEKKLRGFEITIDGIIIGEPLINFKGIFSGIPEETMVEK